MTDKKIPVVAQSNDEFDRRLQEILAQKTKSIFINATDPRGKNAPTSNPVTSPVSAEEVDPEYDEEELALSEAEVDNEVRVVHEGLVEFLGQEFSEDEIGHLMLFLFNEDPDAPCVELQQELGDDLYAKCKNKTWSMLREHDPEITKLSDHALFRSFDDQSIVLGAMHGLAYASLPDEQDRIWTSERERLDHILRFASDLAHEVEDFRADPTQPPQNRVDRSEDDDELSANDLTLDPSKPSVSLSMSQLEAIAQSGMVPDELATQLKTFMGEDEIVKTMREILGAVRKDLHGELLEDDMKFRIDGVAEPKPLTSTTVQSRRSAPTSTALPGNKTKH